MAYFGTYYGMARLTAPPPPPPPPQLALVPTGEPTLAPTATPVIVASVTPGPPPPTPTPTTKPPTATRTLPPPPTATRTPLPPPTATRTPLPPPTATRTPLPPPTEPPQPTNPNFRADATIVDTGSCTTLRWDVGGIQAVYLDGVGQSQHGSARVCPGQPTRYILRVVEQDGRPTEWPLQIRVNAAPATARFQVEYRGCIPAGNSPVKGQIFDPSRRIIVRRAVVRALVNGQPNVLPPAPSNEDGWYEWFTSPNQDITIHTVTLDGRPAEIIGGPYTVRSTNGCFQHINLVQVP
ncbi:MAG: hypothetical protein KIS91_09555 [Anaerolineae bacterium]|nr:hypothetical protein [Anaerolineae bacterium]